MEFLLVLINVTLLRRVILAKRINIRVNNFFFFFVSFLKKSGYIKY